MLWIEVARRDIVSLRRGYLNRLGRVFLSHRSMEGGCGIANKMRVYAVQPEGGQPVGFLLCLDEAVEPAWQVQQVLGEEEGPLRASAQVG